MSIIDFAYLAVFLVSVWWWGTTRRPADLFKQLFQGSVANPLRSLWYRWHPPVGKTYHPLSCKVEVTHPITYVNTAHKDIVAQETRNGTMWLLGQVERQLVWIATAEAQGDSLEQQPIHLTDEELLR